MNAGFMKSELQVRSAILGVGWKRFDVNLADEEKLECCCSPLKEAHC